MPQLLWIGCLESDKEFKVKASKGYELASAQISQKNLLLGIEKVSGEICDSINGSVLPPYPVYEDRIIEPVEWSHKEGSYDISVGYKNDKYINRMNCKNAMLIAADEWIKNRYNGKELIVFVYSMRSAPMATACRIKEKIPIAKIYLIITDLPQFMDLGQSRFKAFLKSFDWKFIKNMQHQFNGFILYAEKMADYLEIPNGKWILMEGSYDITESTIKPVEKKKAVMYSGKLDNRYGIKMLVDAFMKIKDSDIELWITGSGNAMGYIKECAARDPRIKFYGFLASRQDVLEKQTEASLLVNMRLPSERASAYCFPSKLLEYMATETPVLSFEIAGIPREYFQYLYVIKQENVNALSNEMARILALNIEERVEMGRKAASFIATEKNNVKQCQRVWKFISNLEDEYET